MIGWLMCLSTPYGVACRVAKVVVWTAPLSPAHLQVTMSGQEGQRVPKGRGAVGVEVARDFGEDNGGVFFGKVTSVSGVKRPVYKVLYTDGDGEDLDADQYEYAFSFAARQRGTKLPEDSSDDENGNTARGKGDSMAATASTSPPAAFPTWNNVGKGKKFKPVVSRVNAEAEKTPPKILPPMQRDPGHFPWKFWESLLV